MQLNVDPFAVVIILIFKQVGFQFIFKQTKIGAVFDGDGKQIPFLGCCNLKTP